MNEDEVNEGLSDFSPGLKIKDTPALIALVLLILMGLYYCFRALLDPESVVELVEGGEAADGEGERAHEVRGPQVEAVARGDGRARRVRVPRRERGRQRRHDDHRGLRLRHVGARVRDHRVPLQLRDDRDVARHRPAHRAVDEARVEHGPAVWPGLRSAEHRIARQASARASSVVIKINGG